MNVYDELDGVLSEAMRKTSEGQGGVARAGGSAVPVAERRYSLEGLNVKGTVPLEKIIAAVKRFRSGERKPDVNCPRLNILLSGAPGTGKTAFVRYMAQEAGAPLRSVTCSEILSKWTGEDEKNIARAFALAREENAILFLDEIDSFLQSRTGMDRDWQIQRVNELLQQMEKFGGVMVGATNFPDNLDKAVLRRFTFKLELDYLTDEGKAIFFDRYFRSPLTEAERERLDRIDNLAPGDFRTVYETLYWTCDDETNVDRLEALEAESRAKAGRRLPKIGF